MVNSNLEDRVNDYTLARHYEGLDGKDATKVGRAAARNFKSKMQWCPCGNQLPCPDHGDFPKLFWELTPDNGDYISILQARNLPFTGPAILIHEQEKRAKRAAAEKLAPLDLESAIRDPNSPLVSHAIRRWRAYTPRRPGTPPPDDSWTTQCPCGNQLPCDYHDDLWREVRYVKPWDKNYSAALTRAGIPVYTPTTEEIQAGMISTSSQISSGRHEPSSEATQVDLSGGSTQPAQNGPT